MPRQPRIFVPGLTMHVIQRGAHQADMFHDDDDHAIFLDMLQESTRIHDVGVHATVLMSNHLHLMVTPGSSSSLPNTMQQLGRWYVPHYNRRYGKTGALWQGRYRAIPIETERYWLTCLRYVEQNPVRAGIAGSPGDYEWSSYRAHADGQWPAWLVPHAAYLALGLAPAEREAAYRAICAEALPDPELSALRYAVHHGWAYGSPAFGVEIEAASGRRATPRSARRPAVGKLECDYNRGLTPNVQLQYSDDR